MARISSFLSAFTISCLLQTACIEQKNLFQNESNGTQNKRQELQIDTEFFYPFSTEQKEYTAEIILKTESPLAMEEMQAPFVPPLKYNKELLFMLTQDDCKQVAFCCTWAAINGRPLSNQYFYQLGHLQHGDLPPDTYELGKTLGSTDGAGNEVRFSFATTLSPEWDYMKKSTQIYKDYTKDYYRFFMQQGLAWGDVKEMLNYGVGISFHDLKTKENTVENLLRHYEIAQDIIKERLNGRVCKMVTKPSGIEAYIAAAQQYKSIQTLASNSSRIIYPENLSEDLQKEVLNREFYEGPTKGQNLLAIERLKREIDNQATQAPENRSAINLGIHSTDESWVNFLVWLNDTYGKDGADNLWMPNQKEYYEYNYYRTHSRLQLEKVDQQTLKLTVVLSGGENFYYPSITVNLPGIRIEQIASITSNDAVQGLSVANYGQEAGTMLNIDCRIAMTEHAENFVKRYENKPNDKLAQADALYFVRMLKPSAKKDALLQRIR